MKRIIFLIIFCLIVVNFLKSDVISKDQEQAKTIMISGELISKEAVDKLLAMVKQRLEEGYYWGKYELNQEIKIRIIYTYEEYFKSVLNKKVILVLVENVRKEIWPYKINEDGVVASDIIWFLGADNRRVRFDGKEDEIGEEFFRKGAFETSVKIEGTYTIPPIKVVTKLQKKEVECVKEFVKKLIKEKGWESKFPKGQVNIWMGISSEEDKEEDDYQPVVDFYIENDEDWGFMGFVELNKERTECELAKHRLAINIEYKLKPPDFYVTKRKSFYYKDIIKLDK